MRHQRATRAMRCSAAGAAMAGFSWGAERDRGVRVIAIGK
jgi:hypothetical protein